MLVLERRLRDAGWPHHFFASPVPAAELRSLRLTALIVDIALLGDVAEDYLAAVHTQLPTLGVIICTQRSTVAQRARALRQGADDWLSKPYHPDELLARIEAVLRRHRRAAAVAERADPVSAGELVLDSASYAVHVAGDDLKLTRREYEVLRLLIGADGRVVPRDEIYERVWGYAMVHGDRSVDVFIRKLRGKLKLASPTWRYLHTHFGVGYRFTAEQATVR